MPSPKMKHAMHAVQVVLLLPRSWPGSTHRGRGERSASHHHAGTVALSLAPTCGGQKVTSVRGGGGEEVHVMLQTQDWKGTANLTQSKTVVVKRSKGH